jgi:hypothetical protein
MANHGTIKKNQMLDTYGVIQAKITEEVWKNPSLKDKLRHQPKATVEELISYSIDPDVNVRMIECADNEVVFFMPPQKSAVKNVLSEEDLQAVAGGKLSAKDKVGLFGALMAATSALGEGLATVIPGDENAKKTARNIFGTLGNTGKALAGFGAAEDDD